MSGRRSTSRSGRYAKPTRSRLRTWGLLRGAAQNEPDASVGGTITCAVGSLATVASVRGTAFVGGGCSICSVNECSLRWASCRSSRIKNAFCARWTGRRAKVLRSRRSPARRATALRRYFEGDCHAIEQVGVRMKGTAFQQSVWLALRQIPAGETISYGELARRLQATKRCTGGRGWRMAQTP